MRLKNLPRDKSTNMNIANEYEDRNNPFLEPVQML
jgi:hypothetical protein